MNCPHCHIRVLEYPNHYECPDCSARWTLDNIQTRKPAMTSIGQLRRELKRAQQALAARNTKIGRMEDAMEFPALTPQLWDLLSTQGFKTGSEVYAPGIASADEDWCIHISPQAFIGYAAGIEDDSYFETDGFASLYAHDNSGKAVNILCFSDYNLFEAWHKTTQVMENLMQTTLYDQSYKAFIDRENPHRPLAKIFEKKWCRVRLFSALRDILWPVEVLQKPMAEKEALRWNKCKVCGRKALFFTSRLEKHKYLEDGICERCREENLY